MQNNKKKEDLIKMKKQKINKKLALNKSTIADLSAPQMKRARGMGVCPVATFSMLVRCFVCESDGDPCQTVLSVCPCSDPGTTGGGGGSREPSVCELCEG